MDQGTRAIYDALKQAARRQNALFYEDIAPLAGIDLGNLGDRTRLSHMLESISLAEHAQGRPLLTAIVVLKGRLTPGSGFFGLAQRCGVYDGVEDKDLFFSRYLQTVFDAWNSPEARRW